MNELIGLHLLLLIAFPAIFIKAAGETIEQSEKHLSRKRRYLIFPKGSSLQLGELLWSWRTVRDLTCSHFDSDGIWVDSQLRELLWVRLGNWTSLGSARHGSLFRRGGDVANRWLALSHSTRRKCDLDGAYQRNISGSTARPDRVPARATRSRRILHENRTNAMEFGWLEANYVSSTKYSLDQSFISHSIAGK